MRYAIVRNGLVQNVVVWDGDILKWQPPVGCSAIPSDIANIGDTWNGTSFIPDTTPPDPETARIQQAIAQLKTTFNTTRTITQINNSLDALTILMRQAWKDLR